MCTMWQDRYRTSCISMVEAWISCQNRLLDNRLLRLSRGQTLPVVVTNCLICELRILHPFIFTYDRYQSIMTVFVFYGHWGSARCKGFSFLTYHRQVMVVFVLPFWSKPALVLLYYTFS